MNGRERILFALRQTDPKQLQFDKIKDKGVLLAEALGSKSLGPQATSAGESASSGHGLRDRDIGKSSST